jgi:hypothetical protein
VTSRKDQQQYWVRSDEPYRYVPVKKFAEAFKSFHVGLGMTNELAVPFDRSKSHPAALTTSKYGVSTKELLKAQIGREILLIKRNSFVYIYMITQVSHINIHKSLCNFSQQFTQAPSDCNNEYLFVIKICSLFITTTITTKPLLLIFFLCSLVYFFICIVAVSHISIHYNDVVLAHKDAPQ